VTQTQVRATGLIDTGQGTSRHRVRGPRTPPHGFTARLCHEVSVSYATGRIKPGEQTPAAYRFVTVK